ncbi:MAG TPA: hypothetical protein VGQ80_10875 [Acidimicrobiia bacterium]|nr:hypothetical protein [Acidimicrobiia bacterium]
MQREHDPGDVLEEVAQIHPAVARLRQLLASATILDLKATADSYWADHHGDGVDDGDGGGGGPGDDAASPSEDRPGR